MRNKSKKEQNKRRLIDLKRAKLKFKESQLQLQNKQKADPKTITHTMKEIQILKKEINSIK